ncbi:Pancreatic lipase-related protein 2 [Armadillidium nasatum]|uniref:Pancreatic lipase-related protein 2 n=1 Tax=Armadillidium nasatum TaxID=96803 RepID=A0A5N5SJ29_9CRUS|nr:Pancreatic lipase-related protein 2 [Armadillidium nasatum]
MDFRVFMNLFTFFEALKPGNKNDSKTEQIISTTKEPFLQVELPEVLNYKDDDDCRGNLGCFPTSSPWWAIERPVSLAPGSIEEIEPFFCFYSNIHPDCKQRFLFLHSTEIPWIKSLVASLINNLDDNVRVMALDWENGSTPPYAQAVANTSYLFKSDNCSQVGRITGLDPAGPYFLGTKPEVHLDHSDAFLVDIFHTDSTSFIPTFPVSLGLPIASGHFDFFPNGGGQQKGCPQNSRKVIS